MTIYIKKQCTQIKYKLIEKFRPISSFFNTKKSGKYKDHKMFKQSRVAFLIVVLIIVVHTAIFAVGIGPAASAASGAAGGAAGGATGGAAGGAAGGATGGAAGGAAGGMPVLELYMHDILGGSSPTARPITGLLGNIYSGQVPFARPIGFIPPKGGVAIPNANGALPTVNLNGIPLGTGLAGTTFAGQSNVQNPNGQIQTQIGPDGLGLGFGTITVIDDILTSSPELGSQQMGKAQGVYVASSADGSTQMMAFTAMFEGGEFGDTLNFYGIYRIGSSMSHLSVTGGTGKFKNAIGFAEVRGLIPPGQHFTDGAETLLRITVHLKY